MNESMFAFSNENIINQEKREQICKILGIQDPVINDAQFDQELLDIAASGKVNKSKLESMFNERVNTLIKQEVIKIYPNTVNLDKGFELNKDGIFDLQNNLYINDHDSFKEFKEAFISDADLKNEDLSESSRERVFEKFKTDLVDSYNGMMSSAVEEAQFLLASNSFFCYDPENDITYYMEDDEISIEANDVLCNANSVAEECASRGSDYFKCSDHGFDVDGEFYIGEGARSSSSSVELTPVVEQDDEKQLDIDKSIALDHLSSTANDLLDEIIDETNSYIQNLKENAIKEVLDIYSIEDLRKQQVISKFIGNSKKFEHTVENTKSASFKR